MTSRLLAWLTPPVAGCERALADVYGELHVTDERRLRVAIESALRLAYERGAFEVQA